MTTRNVSRRSKQKQSKKKINKSIQSPSSFSSAPEEYQQTIPPDIFMEEILSRISPEKIKGEFNRTQTSWKRLVENKYNKGKKIKGIYNVDWQEVYNLLYMRGSSIEGQWDNLFRVEIDNSDYIRLAVDLGVDPMDNIALEHAIGNNLPNIIKYLLDNYEYDYEGDFHLYVSTIKQLKEAIKKEIENTNEYDIESNDYYDDDKSIDSESIRENIGNAMIISIIDASELGNFEAIKVFLDYNKNGFEHIAEFIVYPSFWKGYLKKYYNFDVDSDNDDVDDLTGTYHFLESIDNILERYRDLTTDYDKTRTSLGNLLNNDIVVHHPSWYHDYDGLSRFKYAIGKGCPITYGDILTNAVTMWRTDALKLISEVRLMYYMSDNKRASKLLNTINSIKHNRELLKYIENYIRKD